MENYSSFACSCQGENHIKKNIVCQDSSARYDDLKYSFAASADGHGSRCYFRSDRGSEFAVDCALECVMEFLRGLKDTGADLNNEDERDELFMQLWRSIVSHWHSDVEADFKMEPFTDEELDGIPEQFAYYRERYNAGKYIEAYGTTLAFAVVTDEFGFCMQIGDGSCVAISDNGEAYEPVPEDPRCHDNITTSLCQDDAAYAYRAAYFSKENIPPVIFLGTDGVENSYYSTELLFGFYRGLALTFCEYGMEEGERQLKSFLPEMTRKGSGDDVTCAGIIDMARLRDMEGILREMLTPEVPEQPEETAVEAAEETPAEDEQPQEDAPAAENEQPQTAE